MPGTSTPVTIDNVNDEDFPEYYVNNGDGFSEPQFSDPNVIGYDGYTAGLRAIKGGLICGETYHLKLVVADSGDNILDSGVFLRSGSLSSNLTVQIELIIEATTEDGTMNEECGLSTLHFIRPPAISSDIEFVVEVEYGGTAENGVDYTFIPEDIIFDPGIDTITYILDAFEDGITEGIESVQFNMQNLAVCQGEAVPSFFEFFITESSQLEIEGYEVDICNGATVDITPIVLGGSGGFEYTWSTSETTAEISVDPAETTVYSVNIADTCLVTSDDADITVNVASFPTLEVSVSPNELDIDCNWFGEFISGSASGGDGTYFYEWTNQDDETLSTTAEFFMWQAEQELYLTVTDGCGIEETEELPIQSDVIPLNVEISDQLSLCEGEHTIEALIEGNDPLSIQWYDEMFNLLGSTAELTLDVTDNTTLSLFVNDNCGQFFNQNVSIEVVEPAELIIEQMEDFTASCLEEVTVETTVISGIPAYQYEWGTVSGMNLGDDSFTTLVIEQTEDIYVTVSDACGEIAQDTVLVTLIQTPLEITVPEFLQGDCLTEFEIEAEINFEGDLPISWNGPEDMELVDNYNVTYQSLNSGTIIVSADAGCSNTDEETISVTISSPPLFIESTEDQLICEGETAWLETSATGGSGQYAFEWISENSYEVGISVTPANSTLYTVEVTDECLNTASTESYVELEQLSIAFSYIQEDFNTFQFNPFVSEDCTNCSFTWEFSDGVISNELNPTHTFSSIGEYGATLTVVSESGCPTQFTDYIYTPIIYIPNSFTPNNDGLNDVFKASILGVETFKIQIFNRWGEIVFESADTDFNWDGSHKNGDYYNQTGVYNYLISYKSLDTSAKEIKGVVNLIR